MAIEDIKLIQLECRKLDDDLRWLVALVSDTGLRLAEATGLHRDDFVLKDPFPRVQVREQPWRRLKTASSTREVPLVGASLWAAQQILADPGTADTAFPRYNASATTNANAASAALNKWVKSKVQSDVTMHSFRHSMRDRLRAVECPADIVDQIGGWRTDGVGHGYGTGYPIDVLAKWMQRVT